MRWILIIWLLFGEAKADVLTRAEIQRQLDETGYCWVPPAKSPHAMDGSIYVRSSNTLAGSGQPSALAFPVGTDWGVIVEPPAGGKLYGAYVNGIALNGAGMLLREIAQHSSIERVWVSDSGGDGFRVEGTGERIVFRDCVAWKNHGRGFSIVSAADNNGVLFDHCNAQGNWQAGVYFAPAASDVASNCHVLRDCTIQGNCKSRLADLNGDGIVNRVDVNLAAGRGDFTALVQALSMQGVAPDLADVELYGWVGRLRVENTWIEATAARHGLLARPRAWPGSETRYVGFLNLCGNTHVYCSTGTDAIRLEQVSEAWIEEAEIRPMPAQLVYTGNRPGGALRLLQQGQVASELGASSSQPLTPARKP